MWTGQNFSRLFQPPSSGGRKSRFWMGRSLLHCRRLAGIKSLSALFLAAGLTVSARAVEVHPEDKPDLSSWRMATVPTNATSSLGSWIWTKHAFDKQTCRLWKNFTIPAGAKVTRAQIRMTTDNGYRLFLDGRELGQGAEWRALTEYDVTLLLAPGRHVLAVSAFNEFFQGGLILGLRIEFAKEPALIIQSDESWRVVPEDEPGWETMTQPRNHWAKVVIVAALGAKPWNGYWPLDFVSVPRLHPIIVPFWQTGWFHVLLLLLFGSFILVCFVLATQLALQTKEQKLLYLERARIARDIHDDFGTRLTKIILDGEVAQSELVAEPATCARFARIGDGLRDTLGAMDEVLWAVNPRRDTLRDFVTYICEYAQTFLQATSIQCLLEVEPDMPALNFELPLRRSLLLAVKEAINNAAKHSGATKLVLQIHRQEPALVVVVEDDGRGFDRSQISRERNGLTNMVQRMNEVGGQCRIVSQPGKGCRVEFSVPLTRPHSRLWRVARRWHHQLDQRRATNDAKAAVHGGADDSEKI